MSTIEKCDINSSDSLHDCTKVQITVAEARLRDGSVVLLERGLAPVAGLIHYPLYLWDPTGSAAVTTSSQAIEASDDELSFYTALDHRRKFLHELGFVLAHEDMRSAALRRVVWSKCRSAAADDSNEDDKQSLLQTLCPLDHDSFLLRELRPDLLPGRSVAHPPGPKSTPGEIQTQGQYHRLPARYNRQ